MQGEHARGGKDGVFYLRPALPVPPAPNDSVLRLLSDLPHPQGEAAPQDQAAGAEGGASDGAQRPVGATTTAADAGGGAAGAGEQQGESRGQERRMQKRVHQGQGQESQLRADR